MYNKSAIGGGVMRIHETLHDLTIHIHDQKFRNFRLLKGRYTKMYQIRFNGENETYFILFKKEKNNIQITKFIKCKKVSRHQLLCFKGKKGERQAVFTDNWECIMIEIVETCFKGIKKDRIRFLFSELSIKDL